MSNEHKEWLKGRVLKAVDDYKNNTDTTNSGWNIIRYSGFGFLIPDLNNIPDQDTLQDVVSTLDEIINTDKSKPKYMILRYGKLGYLQVDLSKFQTT